ncbi:MAG: arylsulfatase [Bryobacteraceae bacterium]
MSRMVCFPEIMNRRSFLSTIAAAAHPTARAQPHRPNILLIMADDMGFSDLGCYGGEISTPNIDALAKRGVRFRQFYNTARCCPTRASLMTGLYAHQAGVGHMVDTPKPWTAYKGDLSPNSVTIAEALKPAGYRTYMSGKWHVTPVNDSKHNWPRQRGFDRFFGTIHGAGSFFDPVTLTRDNEPIQAGKDFYYTDAIADNAAACIRDHASANADAPFFLYCAFTSPHWPLHALANDIAKYKGRYEQGWDALRAERRQRMIQMGIVDKRWPITPRDPSVPAWADAPNKEWQERRMEVYAAQVDRMDQGIGRIVAELKHNGAFDNTLILFLADNGGCAEELGPNGRGRHFPQQRRDGGPVALGNDPSRMPGGEDTYQSYGTPWANASNTPFRLYKHWVHEGGISTPFIAHWPGQMREGRMTDSPGHLVDVMATCCDVGGAKYPETRVGEPVTPAEGTSLTPAFSGRRLPEREIYWEHEGNRAIRAGDWKLVSRHPGTWELYNMPADRTELRDLSGSEPGRVAAMTAKWDAWAKRVGVEDWEKVRRG